MPVRCIVKYKIQGVKIKVIHWCHSAASPLITLKKSAQYASSSYLQKGTFLPMDHFWYM